MPRKIREFKKQILREGFIYLPKRGKGSLGLSNLQCYKSLMSYSLDKRKECLHTLFPYSLGLLEDDLVVHLY